MNRIDRNARKAAPLLASAFLLCMVTACSPTVVGERGGGWDVGGIFSPAGVAGDGGRTGAGTGAPPPASDASGSGGGGGSSASGGEPGARQAGTGREGACLEPSCAAVLPAKPGASPPIIPPMDDLPAARGRDIAVTPKGELTVTPQKGLKADGMRATVKPRIRDFKNVQEGATMRQQ
jgi:hypothetical protein